MEFWLPEGKKLFTSKINVTGYMANTSYCVGDVNFRDSLHYVSTYDTLEQFLDLTSSDWLEWDVCWEIYVVMEGDWYYMENIHTQEDCSQESSLEYLVTKEFQRKKEEREKELLVLQEKTKANYFSLIQAKRERTQYERLKQKFEGNSHQNQ